jgi:hypothetical protein
MRVAPFPTPRYEADIVYLGGGVFRVTGRDIDLVVVSADPEYDYAHELACTLGDRLQPETGILFWRGSTPSISFSSVLKASRVRIDLGSKFPALRKRMSDDEKAAMRARLAVAALALGSMGPRRQLFSEPAI